MSAARFAAGNVRRWLPIILYTGALSAQTCLVLSPSTIKSDGTASLELALYSVTGTRPAAVQWTFQYPSASVRRLAVDDGPALTAAGQTAVCAGDAAAYNCMTAGKTAQEVIADGVIAKITAVLAPGGTTAAILIKNTLGTSQTGNPIPISSIVRSGSGTASSSDCTSPPKEKGRPGK